MEPLVGQRAPAPLEGVTTAVVVIHGTGRDASSCLRAMMAAMAGASASSSGIEAQMADVKEVTLRPHRTQDEEASDDGEGAEATEYDESLVIAPWFLAPANGVPAFASSLPFVTWVDRYGTESIPNDNNGGNDAASSSTISSYGVLLGALCDRRNYPDMERIVVVGHSAGGQGLTSASWCFSDSAKGVSASVDAGALLLNGAVAAYLDVSRYLSATAASAAAARGMAMEDRGGDEAGTLSQFDMLDLTSELWPTLVEDTSEYGKVFHFIMPDGVRSINGTVELMVAFDRAVPTNDERNVRIAPGGDGKTTLDLHFGLAAARFVPN